MKLKRLNEGYKEDELFDNSVGKYVRARGRGNINQKQAVDDPDKTEQPDRSGNQYAVATDDDDAKDLLGASEGDRDKIKPGNLVGNPSPSI